MINYNEDSISKKSKQIRNSQTKIITKRCIGYNWTPKDNMRKKICIYHVNDHSDHVGIVEQASKSEFVFISTALFYFLPVICKFTRKDSHML